MAYYYPEPSHTFSEYLLVPGYTSEECIPDNVSLKTPLVKYRKGEEECPISLNIPLVSAIMQAVSNDTLAVALAKEGGLSFIYGSQSIADEAAMVRRVKSSKAGFVISASNLTPDHTLADVLALKEKNGFSTVAITEDATPNGKLLGLVTSRDYRVTRMSTDGNRYDHIESIGVLDSITESILNAYMVKSHGLSTRDELKRMMRTSTWLTAPEAKGLGLVDRILGEDAIDPNAILNCAGGVSHGIRSMGTRPMPSPAVLRVEYDRLVAEGKAPAMGNQTPQKAPEDLPLAEDESKFQAAVARLALEKMRF